MDDEHAKDVETPDSERPAAEAEENKKSAGSIWLKLLVLVVVIAVAAGVYVRFGDALSLKYLAEKESVLRQHQESSPILVFSLAFVLYVSVTGLSLPGAAALSLVYGWYFGLVRGTVLVSFASTGGATLAFLLSRYILRDSIQRRFGKRLDAFNKNLEKDGPFYLFTLRLIPAMPFFIINVVMGLTPIRTRTFWWVSQLGMLPGTIVYINVGASVPDLDTLAEQGLGGILSVQLFAAFAVLGIFPLAVRFLARLIRK